MPAAVTSLATSHAEIRLRESQGTGMPVVLIHGAGASSAVFARQFESSLASRHRLIAFDLPGHGGSADAIDPARTYSIPGFADLAAEVLDRLAVERAVVFGWSLGGHVAIELLARTTLVAGLMLTGAPPVPRGPIGMLRGFQVHRDMLLASKEQFSERDVERYLRMVYGPAPEAEFVADIQRTDGRARTGVFKAILRGEGVDQKRAVERTQTPIALVDGEFEPVARRSYVAHLGYPTLWDNAAHVIPGVGHAPFWADHRAFNALLDGFVGDVEAVEAASFTRARPLARSA